MLLLGALLIVATPVRADQCLTCHEALGDAPSSLFNRDIHHLKGMTCADCHGGDASTGEMDRAMDKGKGFIGVPKGDDISARCAGCHADKEKMERARPGLPATQLQELQASVHGKLSTTGKERIAQCTTCHNAHGIVAVTDPRSPVHPSNLANTCAHCHANTTYMRSYNPSLSVDQLEKYRTSVHGMRNARGDIKTAECAHCHGSHEILPATDVRSKVYPANLPGTCASCHANAAYMKHYGIPTDQYDKFARSVHGVALLQKHDLGAPACNDCHGNHGATPPGVESISKVCGTCHALNADLFSASPHKEGFDKNKWPECETCHGNHEIVAAKNSLLGVTPEAVCSRCHSAHERPAGYQVAALMRRLIDSLESSDGNARQLVDEAEQKGMEISEAKFKLRDVHQARLEARTKVHSFNEPQFREVVNNGFAAAAFVHGEARHAIDEYYFRRIGLGVSTLIITILAVSLYLFIRRLERNPVQKNTTT
jgi:predicted CXXCH cytochrome family protein